MPKDCFLNQAHYGHGDIHHDCYQNPSVEAWDVVKWRRPSWLIMTLMVDHGRCWKLWHFGMLQIDYDPHDVGHDPHGVDCGPGQFTTTIIKWKLHQNIYL